MRIMTAMMVLCFALFTMSAMAQTSTTGSIEGTVTDVNGAAVPGVTVSVTSPNLIRPQSATTNDEGIYRIPNLPPGRYIVVVEAASGFGRYEQTDVEVNLSKTSNVTISLRPAGATEVVEVTASSGAAVDVTTATTGTNISTEQFSNFPTQRTVQSLYTIAPTVTRSGLRDSSGRDRDPSVGGSSGPENNYILDGVTVSDPAFGGSGANLPFEFVQEVEIKTGAVSAEYGKATGGIFNVVTKSGSNEIRGDVFAFFTSKSFVREVKTSAIPFTGSAPNGFSEVDAGFDIGGPIIKDKLWFFGAFNPQMRKNYFLTQTLAQEVNNKVTTPFYAGKITWGINQNNTFNFSTFGDFTRQEGFLFGNAGFGSDLSSFQGTTETGGSNYAFRLNSVFTPNFIAEFSVGLHFQRANTIPSAGSADQSLVTDRFAILRNGAVLTPVNTAVTASNGLRLAFVDGAGGTVQRNFVRQGFGLRSDQDRDRFEAAARLQNVWGKHTFKYGAELTSNKYKINTFSTGPTNDFGIAGVPALRYRVENRFAICQRTGAALATLTCADATRVTRATQLLASGALAGTGITSVVQGPVSGTNITNPFLLLDVVRVRDFSLNTQGGTTSTDVQSFYLQDDFKVTRNLQLNLGLRWDFQQAKGTTSDYLTLNDFRSNTQPRLGLIWDFTGQGRGKIFANYARYLETPIPLDVNVRAAGDEIQNDFNLNANRLNAPVGTGTVTGGFLGNLGNHSTPFDPGLKPQTVNEFTAGIDFEVVRDLSLGFRGIYRAQDEVIEDGSFDDGTNYFLFNPGRRGNGETTEDLACAGDASQGIAAQCFGKARRYYRALEFTATKRFRDNYQFIASYVFSSLIGNYEGLFRNDNGQSDPNITSLFDLVSLLRGTYGRLPNDRPHQFKFDGSYRFPFKLMTSASFRAQSGIPFNALIPHPLYGDNEGFCQVIAGLGDVCHPRGTAINPFTNSDRTPTTYNLDLGAYYPIQFDEDKQLRFQVDVFNVFNNQRAIRQDETFLINSGAPGITPVPNPFFGNGTIFQFPTALRLGVKFQF
ncbi:MAG TPA: TonB-dependent receptor [Pyrinomonadaceae bacterium]|jgi:outer membrane receptor protein involved in Fe transport|nr:TonB-dependent receptor [Pyrinomonadaceae bacterium]